MSRWNEFGTVGEEGSLEGEFGWIGVTRHTAYRTTQRNFGMMSMLGFSCTILITWEGIVV